MSDRPRKARTLFIEATENIPEEEWADFLARECGADATLRSHVQKLLDAHNDLTGFMEEPAAGQTTLDRKATERAGDSIGPYKLLQKIGEGGFGVVYMAEQHRPIRRKVALKVIKPGMDTKEVIGRFEAERQALAMMDHPNIAKVLDAGMTDSGRPHFVMELVRGIPITEYCDSESLGTRQRLELFAKVCQAVQHAHQKGVIHRDIKPSNVLVTEHDGEPVPKVIDFGVAKALNQQLTEHTVFTQFQQMIGTPIYMSPEQAALSGLDIDARSDIYSLGVLLYELLTGTTPFDKKRFTQAAYDEIRRIIREEEPPKPSTKISTMGQESGKVAGARMTDIKKLRQIMRGELDWIVMKALEKDRKRRYETANGFAKDIQRYLDGDSVQACPPSTSYRLRKFAHRNRAVFLTTSVVGVSLLVGLVVAVWQAVRATNAEVAAEASERQALAETLRATSEARRADRKSIELNRQLRVSTVNRLAAQSRSMREDRPVLSLLLAKEAVETTFRRDVPAMPIAPSTLLNALGSVGGRPLVGHQGAILSCKTSSSGRWLATAGMDNTVRLWDLRSDDPAVSCHVFQFRNIFFLSFDFSPDSQWLVTSESLRAGGRVELWNLQSMKPNESSEVLSTESVSRVTFGPNGRWLAARKSQDKCYLWDLSKNASSRNPILLHDQGPPGRLADGAGGLAFSHDGRWLATGTKRGSVRLWDLTSPDPASESIPLLAHSDAVPSLVFSPDGSWLVTGCQDATVRLWDLSSEDPSKDSLEIDDHSGQGMQLAVSSKGRWLASASTDHIVRVWDLRSNDPSENPRLLVGHTAWVRGLAISEDERWLVSGGRDKTARAWDLAAEDPSDSSIVLRGHDAPLEEVVFSSPTQLITGSEDGTARLWDFGDDGPISSPSVFRAHNDKVSTLAISSDGHWLATGSRDGSAVLWDVSGRVPRVDFHLRPKRPDSVNRVVISARGRWIASSAGTSSLLWPLTHRGIVDDPIELGGHTDQIQITKISPNEKWMVTHSVDQTRLWDLESTDPSSAPRTLVGECNGNKKKMQFSRDGRWFVMSPGLLDDPNAWLWDLESEDVVASKRDLPMDRHTISVAFTPDSKRLSVASREIRLWNLSNSEPTFTKFGSHQFDVFNMQFSTNGKWLATGGWNSDARLWDLTSEPTTFHKLRDIKSSVYHIEFSPDSRWLATTVEDGTVRLWGCEADDPTVAAFILRNSTEPIAFSPDGNSIYTGQTDNSVRRWELNVESLLSTARNLAGRELTTREKERFQVEVALDNPQ